MSTALAPNLTDKQSAFVESLLSGMSPSEAQKVAGYESPSAYVYLLGHPTVLAAVHVGVQKSLAADVPTNLRVLRAIRDDPNAPARVRADIGIKLTQMAGHVVPRSKDERDDKPLSQMSQAELLEFIARNEQAIGEAEAALAGQAKDVTPVISVQAIVPTKANAQAKALDYLD